MEINIYSKIKNKGLLRDKTQDHKSHKETIQWGMSEPFIVIEEVNMVNCIESHTINLLSFVKGPSLCHREKAVGIYIQYILLAVNQAAPAIPFSAQLSG